MLSEEVKKFYPILSGGTEHPGENSYEYKAALEAIVNDQYNDLQFVKTQVQVLMDTLNIKIPKGKMTFMERQKFQANLIMSLPKALKKFVPDEDSDDPDLFDWKRIEAVLEKYK
jgi:hypothetical protein